MAQSGSQSSWDSFPDPSTAEKPIILNRLHIFPDEASLRPAQGPEATAETGTEQSWFALALALRLITI